MKFNTIFLLSLFTLISVVMSVSAWLRYNYYPLDECARNNNVYQCEWVAVPKGNVPPITDSELEGVE